VGLMMLKQFLAYYCLSPALLDLSRRLRGNDGRARPSSPTAPPCDPPAPTERPEFEYVPEGWAGRGPRVGGWDVESILQAQLARWPEFVKSVAGDGVLGRAHEASLTSAHDYAAHNTKMAFAYVLALAARNKARLSMLDCGGGIGHYCLLARALLPDVSLDYSCWDVPTLCRGGRQVLPNEAFHDRADEAFARTYDLVLCSGALQYFEDWGDVARRMAAATDGYLYVTRVPVVHRVKSFVVVQRPYRYGYQTEYLGWFLNRQELLDRFRSLGMTLVRELLIQERYDVPSAPEQADYRGLLFRPSGKAATP
jgi:putative methyltransferase (TIGR04325 family)